MADTIGGIFAGIFAIGGVILFLWGFLYAMNKFFGVTYSSRGNYQNEKRINNLSHIHNIEELSKYDEETIQKARKNLRKNFYANTSDNLLEEIRKFGPPKPVFYMPQASNNKLDFYGFYYQDILYYCYEGNQTTYFKFSHNDKCIILLLDGIPDYEKVPFGFNFFNDTLQKCKCIKISNDLMRLTFKHGNSNYIYELHGKNPDKLKVTRQQEGAVVINDLEFDYSI